MSGLSIDGVGVSLLGRRVVDDVSITIPAGHWLTVVGPNGAGKSTLLRALAGAVPYDGRIELDGVRLTDLRARQELLFERRRQGRIAQHAAHHLPAVVQA